MAFGVATVFTTTGKAIVAKRLIGATPAQITPNFQAIGVGATGAARTAVVGDTALSTEVETRVNTNAFTTDDIMGALQSDPNSLFDAATPQLNNMDKTIALQRAVAANAAEYKGGGAFNVNTQRITQTF